MKPFLFLLLLLSGSVFSINGQTPVADNPDTAGSFKQAIVPQVVGYTLDEAKGILLNCRLKQGTVTQELSTAPAGEVIAQEPRQGMTVARGTAVNLTVSNLQNTAQIRVPDVTGLNIEKATQVMQEAGLRMDQIYYRISLAKEETVFRQQPAAGQEVKAGTHVFLAVSRHKHVAAWIVWITVLAFLIFTERLFKWRTIKEMNEHRNHSNHHKED